MPMQKKWCVRICALVISRTYHLPHSGCLRGTEAPCHIVTPAFVPVGTNTRQVTCSSRSQAHTVPKSKTHTHTYTQKLTHKWQIHMNTYKSIVSHNHHFGHKVILGHFFAKKILIFIKLSFPISISANCRTWTLFASCCAWWPPILNYINPLLRL